MRMISRLATALTLALPGAAFAEPNILLIIADDMGLDASRCYSLGDQQAPMPNVEALCASGMVFDNAYSAPVCSPTRATIMTGQYGFRTGVGAAIPPDGTNGLSADVTSLFDVLATTDYSANLIGKWHLAGADADRNHPAELGVPDYFGLFMGGVRNYSEWTAVTGGEEVQVDGYATTVLTDRAIDWIDAQNDPWFLWLAYNAPHTPFHLPPADLHGFDELADDADAIAENPLPYYNAMLEALDTEIGRLLGSMPQEERDNTVVIFIGDNGSPNQVTRGFYGDHDAKGTIYEGGTHVPLVVTGPGIEPGRTAAFVETVDLFTTIAGMIGAEVSAGDGHDFAPALTGGETTRDFIYVEHFGDPEDAKPSDVFGWALREGIYKLVQEVGEEPELYDLSMDPREQVDLLADGISAHEAAIISQIKERHAAVRGN
ncbi:sulfatase-like hydrolase/transferase [uncultured Marivita sp.]|uniref:sulfatase-like hydrolase/transferase n=1 Tax=uncultured Marivita sp. TaxID=888080 RepID=UPI0026181F25|nr:sulfatase-like hydrolase/transferase [uncultured Marivita sp.]